MAAAAPGVRHSAKWLRIRLATAPGQLFVVHQHRLAGGLDAAPENGGQAIGGVRLETRLQHVHGRQARGDLAWHQPGAGLTKLRRRHLHGMAVVEDSRRRRKRRAQQGAVANMPAIGLYHRRLLEYGGERT